MRNRSKSLLLVVFAFSLLFPIFLIDISPDLPVIWLIGRIFGLWGVIMLVWQLHLGTRGIIHRWIPDLIWINKLHRFLGTYGLLAIAVHPTLIVLYYLQVEVNLLVPKLETAFDFYKLLGTLAFMLLVVTWLVSAVVRGKLNFRVWKRLHLLTWIIVPLTIVHSLGIGTGLNTNQTLRAYWFLLLGLYMVFLCLRLLSASGKLKYSYSLTTVTKHNPQVSTLYLRPNNKRFITPLPGQFIYVQLEPFGEAHPFTVSHFDVRTSEIGISPKALGKFSSKLADLSLDSQVFLEGPYGVFTQEALHTLKPIVLIAGGIGITPFLRLINMLRDGRKQKVTLFYGNKTEADLAFGKDLESTMKLNKNFMLVNVLSEQSDYAGETGNITSELISKYVPDLASNLYFICGPAEMIRNVKTDLTNAGIPKTQLFTEKFSL